MIKDNIFNSSFVSENLSPIPLDYLKEADKSNIYAFKDLAQKNEFEIKNNEKWGSLKGILIIVSCIGNIISCLACGYLFL